jgi:DNA-binding winged helix-turn-helix (wHTH) protein
MRYVFGDYTLDTQRYELYRAGTRIPLRPKVFHVLAYLLHHRDRVVPKAELLEHVWPKQFIGDGTLNSCIMAVRKALGDGGRPSARTYRCSPIPPRHFHATFCHRSGSAQARCSSQARTVAS